MKHSTTGLLALLYTSVGGIATAQEPVPPRTEQGSLIFDGIPANNGSTEVASLNRWLESRSTSFVDWLADGSLIIATRFGNVAQLHRVRAPAGMREQITWSSEPVSGATAHPYDANTLLVANDKGGDENTQLWLHDIKTGTERLLTDGKSLNGPPVFTQDARRIAFYSNARDGASYDIYVNDITGTAGSQLAIGGGTDALYPQDWSMDDKRLAVIRYASATDSQLLVADVATGVRIPIEPAADYKGGPMAVSQARFSRDARGIYFLSDHGGDFTELRYMDLYSGELRVLTPQTRWDVERFDLSSDGRYVAYTLNEAGVDRLVLHDLRVKADVLLPPLPAGGVMGSIGFDRTSQRLAVALETAQSPRDVFVYTLGAAADDNVAVPTLARWTLSEVGPIDATQLVPAQLVQFPTWDRDGNRQRNLSAFVYKPRTPGPHPVVIDIHGGPESQYRPQWSAFTQYLVNELGYAVVAPNVRGSSGYGRSFMQLDDAVLREDSVRDIGALLVWIGAQSDFNRGRVVAMGGSYGGYMALASLVTYGDRLAGAVDVVGISNFVTFLTNTAPYRRDLRRAEYGDERDAKMRSFLQNISPLTNSAAIRKPLLIVQGLNDPRVPASESEQMMRSVRSHNGEVWYLAAKDEGHGFRKKNNRDVYLATVAQFLRRLKQ